MIIIAYLKLSIVFFLTIKIKKKNGAINTIKLDIFLNNIKSIFKFIKFKENMNIKYDKVISIIKFFLKKNFSLNKKIMKNIKYK